MKLEKLFFDKPLHSFMVFDVRNPFFYRTFFFLLLIELFSLFGYLLPTFNTIAFFILAALVVALALWKLEYGIYCLLAELFVGSKGFLFFWNIGGTLVSLRIALWVIVVAVWCMRFATSRAERSLWKEYARDPLMRWCFVFFAVLLFAVLNGIVHNDFATVFFDSNAWLFFMLIFPFLSVLREQKFFDRISSILFAGVLFTSLQALTTLFIYSHDPLGGVFLPFYRWIRESGVGEVTALSPSFARIFFQSQIYTLIGLFLLLFITPAHPLFYKGGKVRVTGKAIFQVFCLSSLLLSFSRSFWVAGVATLVLYWGLLIFRKTPMHFLVRQIGAVIGIGIASALLIWLVMNFTYPRSSGGSFVRLLEERATTTEEAGVSSRWNLLPPLADRIKNNWFFGSGFGATVTYQSSDPRIVQSSARGNNFYTTYAFEWGYLDLWLKFGLLGLFIYGILLWKIGKQLYLTTYNLQLTTGLFFGFIALLITNIFSPYLNHPLGIGFLLLCIACILSQKHAILPVDN